MRDLKNLPINGGFPYTQKKHWQKKEIYKCATLYNSSDDAGHKGVFKFWNGEKFWLLLSLTTWKLLNLGDDRLMGDWNRRSLDKWQHQRALPVSNPPPVLIFIGIYLTQLFRDLDLFFSLQNSDLHFSWHRSLTLLDSHLYSRSFSLFINVVAHEKKKKCFSIFMMRPLHLQLRRVRRRQQRSLRLLLFPSCRWHHRSHPLRQHRLACPRSTMSSYPVITA